MHIKQLYYLLQPMKKLILVLITTFTLWLVSFENQAQTLPLGTPVLEDAYRRAQLLGQTDLSASFISRPIFSDFESAKHDEISKKYFPKRLLIGNVEKWQPEISLLPVTWIQQYNSNHPDGINDGVLIPARGYQTMISGGLFAKYSILSIQLKPEFVYAQNTTYEGFQDKHPDNVWAKYYRILNGIDTPEKFGNEPYSKAFWGQSSVRLTYRGISLGISNENLWWGPGMHNSLLMTNNAPGFKHITLNTTKPIHTIIGSFEGQIVGGQLNSSGYPGIDSLRLAQHNIKYVSKSNDWRYLNGIVLSYQPKWLPGLFVGAARSFMAYHNDMGNKLLDYVPVFSLFFKKDVGFSEDDKRKKDQYASVFARWVAPESHQEVYFEYGRTDHSYDLTDFILEPEHSAAYIMGFRKLVPIITSKNSFLDIQLEITQLEGRLSAADRAGGLWYTHYQVIDGYTNMGQILGAGIGTGSNMQLIYLGWTKGLKKIGIEMKRVVQNDDFWAMAIKDYRSHWVDLAGTICAEWDYKNILINASIGTTGSNNYKWLYDPVSSDPPLWWDHGKVIYNYRATIGLTYLF